MNEVSHTTLLKIFSYTITIDYNLRYYHHNLLRERKFHMDIKKIPRREKSQKAGPLLLT